jgi:hypothetical protein
LEARLSEAAEKPYRPIIKLLNCPPFFAVFIAPSWYAHRFVAPTNVPFPFPFRQCKKDTIHEGVHGFVAVVPLFSFGKDDYAH